MSLYTRARKHIDINRVKELREDKIRREKIAEILKQQEIICAELAEIEAEESKYINWRRELEEGMNTGSIGLIHLPGDPDTIQTSLPSATLSSADNTADPDENGVTVRTQGFKISDSSKTDTITITISGSFGSKQIGGSTLNDKVSIGVLVNGTYAGNYLAQELGNGTHTISIPKRFQKANVRFDAIQVTAFEGGGGHQSGTVNITGIGLKRVSPMNVFIGLEDPDASAFLRDGQVDNLSPGEKKKKLEEQLASSKEYLNKMFGEGMPKGATEIADYELQQSFSDIAASYPKRDPLDKLLKDIDDADKKAPPFNDPNPPNRRGMGDRWKGAQRGDDIQVASARGPYGTPGADKPYVRRGYKDKDGKFVDFDNPATWPSIVPQLPRVQKKQRTMVAHHELEGEVIVEKKRLKSPKDLTEQMTTAAIGLISLPAEGDVDLENVTKTATPGTSGSGGSGGSYSFGTYDETGNGGFSIVLDTRKYDTLKFTAGSGNATRIELSINGGGFSTLSSGTNTITISAANRRSRSRFVFNAFKSDGSGSTGASISGTVFQRRFPVNAFVGLDDPDSSAFVRNGQTDNLSPGEKKKKLEKQLRSSKKYLNKMFGKGMPNTATTIADYEPQQSYAEIAAAQQGPIRPGPRGYKKPGTYDPNKFYDLKNDPSQLPSPNLPFTGPGYSRGIDGTEVAASYPTTNTPLDKVGGFKGIPKGKGIYPMDKDGNLYNPQTGLPIKKARKRQRTMVAHHEPQGETIMEKNKKSFNDLTKKIPGYYDGKPAPLGFPIVEPPKMKNGMHPDLVDGKKTAKRFNRLDPISAKAMPPTGNPLIDKKVKAAAKKPK